MPWGSASNKVDGDQNDEGDAIPTASQRQRASTELETFDLAISSVNGYDGDDGDDVDGNERKKHRKPMMDQRRMWRTEGIVLESVKIGRYFSEAYNSIMAKYMRQKAIYPKPRLFCKKQRNLTAKHIWAGCSIQYMTIRRGTMWPVAEERHKHCQGLCTQLQHNYCPWEQCNTPIVLMVHICHYIPGAK